MADPLDIFAADEINRLKMPVDTVVITESELLMSINITGGKEEIIKADVWFEKEKIIAAAEGKEDS